MQFMDAMAEDPETLKLAVEGIRYSAIYEALRAKILATHGCFPTSAVTLPPMGQGGSPICDTVTKGSLACQRQTSLTLQI
jgi:hypothetical protein